MRTIPEARSRIEKFLSIAKRGWTLPLERNEAEELLTTIDALIAQRDAAESKVKELGEEIERLNWRASNAEAAILARAEAQILKLRKAVERTAADVTAAEAREAKLQQALEHVLAARNHTHDEIRGIARKALLASTASTKGENDA